VSQYRDDKTSSRDDTQTLSQPVMALPQATTTQQKSIFLSLSPDKDRGSVFLRPRGLQKVRVGSVLSLVANTGLG
jgi:hypothetical protein